MTMESNLKSSAFSKCWIALCAGLSAVCFVALMGCSGPVIEDKEGRLLEYFETPVLLDGPMSTLLTNVDGFTAQVDLTHGKRTMAAMVMGRGTQLLFADEEGLKHPSKKRAGNQTYFIWDVATEKGYVINEPLQGFAPIEAKNKVADVEVKEDVGVYDKIDGVRCRQASVTARLKDGTSSQLTIWRSVESKNFTMRIKADNGRTVIQFHDVKFKSPASDIFIPPTGYTRHENAQMMLDTLVERQVRSKSKDNDWNESHPNDVGQPGFARDMAH